MHRGTVLFCTSEYSLSAPHRAFSTYTHQLLFLAVWLLLAKTTSYSSRPWCLDIISVVCSILEDVIITVFILTVKVDIRSCINKVTRIL